MVYRVPLTYEINVLRDTLYFCWDRPVIYVDPRLEPPLLYATLCLVV